MVEGGVVRVESLTVERSEGTLLVGRQWNLRREGVGHRIVRGVGH